MCAGMSHGMYISLTSHAQPDERNFFFPKKKNLKIPVRIHVYSRCLRNPSQNELAINPSTPRVRISPAHTTRSSSSLPSTTQNAPSLFGLGPYPSRHFALTPRTQDDVAAPPPLLLWQALLPSRFQCVSWAVVLLLLQKNGGVPLGPMIPSSSSSHVSALPAPVLEVPPFRSVGQAPAADCPCLPFSDPVTRTTPLTQTVLLLPFARDSRALLARSRVQMMTRMTRMGEVVVVSTLVVAALPSGSPAPTRNMTTTVTRTGEVVVLLLSVQDSPAPPSVSQALTTAMTMRMREVIFALDDPDGVVSVFATEVVPVILVALSLVVVASQATATPPMMVLARAGFPH